MPHFAPKRENLGDGLLFLGKINLLRAFVMFLNPGGLGCNILARGIFWEPEAFLEMVRVTILVKVPLTIVGLKVENASAMIFFIPCNFLKRWQ